MSDKPRELIEYVKNIILNKEEKCDLYNKEINDEEIKEIMNTMINNKTVKWIHLLNNICWSEVYIVDVLIGGNTNVEILDLEIIRLEMKEWSILWMN